VEVSVAADLEAPADSMVPVVLAKVDLAAVHLVEVHLAEAAVLVPQDSATAMPSVPVDLAGLVVGT
jgi:hypothetical protein